MKYDYNNITEPKIRKGNDIKLSPKLERRLSPKLDRGKAECSNRRHT